MFDKCQQVPESTQILYCAATDSLNVCLQPIMEKWSGAALVPTAVYGIRVYRRGSSLDNHVDRNNTHVISAIINVEQKVCILHTNLPYATIRTKYMLKYFSGQVCGSLLLCASEGECYFIK